jgi:hypothetical protein
MTDQRFQDIVRYGGIALVVCVVLNIWVVMRHFEVYRDAVRVDRQAQEMMLREQILQGVVKDFAARANSDPQIGEIFKKAEAASAPSETGAGLPSPPTSP